jgi:hypothetical protein
MPKARVALATMLFLAGCEEDRITECIFCPPPPDPPNIMRSLAYSYQTRNLELFASLLAHDPDRNADYIHSSCDTVLGSTTWGYDEEICRHKRLFHPEDPRPGDPPVPPEDWLRSLSVNLIQLERFQERSDLYSTNGGADGKLDPAIWKATDARYGVDLFIDTQGETDYQLSSEATFIVIEDRAKRRDDPGKFLLLAWEELCNPVPLRAADLGSHPGAVKSSFR